MAKHNHPIETVSPEGLELQERVVDINRVAKVVKGGRRFSFTALVVVGDEESIVGIGYGKANEVPIAIQKGVDQARKNLFRVPKYKTTITHQTIGRFGAGQVMLKPASEGVGVIAGGGVRAVLELAGVRDILAKSLGTQNPINLVKATVNGLQSLRRPEDVARTRGLEIHEVLGIDKPEPRTPEAVASETAATDAAGAAAETAAEGAPAGDGGSVTDGEAEPATEGAAESATAGAEADAAATEGAATEAAATGTETEAAVSDTAGNEPEAGATESETPAGEPESEVTEAEAAAPENAATESENTAAESDSDAAPTEERQS